MSAGDTLQRLTAFLADALRPFLSSLGSDGEVLTFVAELGWTLPLVPPSVPVLGEAGNAVIDALADTQIAADAVANDSGSDDDLAQAFVKLVVSLGAFALQTQQMRTKLAAELPAAFVAATGIADTFQERLFEDLVVREIGARAPLVAAVAQLVGIVEEVEVAADPQHFQPDHTRRTLRFDRVGPLLNNPESLLKDVYGWGTPTLNLDQFFANIQRLSYPLFGPMEVRYPSDALMASAAPGVPISDDEGPPPVYTIPIYENGPITLVLATMPLPKRVPDELQGIAITLALGLAEETSLTLGPLLTLTLDGTLDLSTGVAAVLRPDSDPAIVLDPEGATPSSLTGKGGARLSFGDPAAQSTRLLTIPGGSFLEVSELHFAAGVDATAGAPDVYVEAGVKGATVTIATGDADSFLASITPKDGLTTHFDFDAEWSQRGGLRLNGGARLDATIPVNATLGPFTVQSAYIGLAADGNSATLELSANGSAAIGPIQATVARLGFTLNVAFQDGNLGPVDFSLGFKPPSGVGLSIDAAGVTGGGFLSHDDRASQYAGMMQLSYQQFQLQAFGLITTKLPTGPGYSMVAMIDATFPPIELVAGFTLNGVGGLFGANRTISTGALQAGLKAHTLSNFLFVKNPVANASQILTDLQKFFPPAQGRYVFGPLLQIGWGTPTAITIDLALILELPDPVRLVLIGELAVFLPSPDAVLVELRMDVLGTIDFGTDEGSLDAVLHDSRIVSYPLQGAMALRGCWAGDDKTFLLAIGGFHPKFQPPPGFPTLQRLAISMPSGHISKLNLNGYLAVSSNTLQLGAHLDIFVGVDGFGISGYLNFDTLIERNPFYFDGDISGGVTLSAGGHDIMSLDLSADLSGPAPWHCAGSVHFSVLGFGVTKSFSTTFGDQAPALPTNLIDVGAAVRAALSDPRNYSATLTTNENGLVTLRTPTVSGVALGHPGATLKINQKICPFGLTIQKFGASAPAGDSRFTITAVTADGAAQTTTPVTDEFAPAQFLNLSDDDELAAPSFEAFDSGVELGDGALSNGPILSRPIVYETQIVDTPGGAPREDAGYTPPSNRLSGILTALQNSGRLRYAMPSQPMVHAPTLDYVVATRDQIAASSVGVATGQTFAQARAALATAIAQNPDQRHTLQVVAHYEVGA